jgi:hypothetical protein
MYVHDYVIQSVFDKVEIRLGWSSFIFCFNNIIIFVFIFKQNAQIALPVACYISMH